MNQNLHCCGCSERDNIDCVADQPANWCRDCWHDMGVRWLNRGAIKDMAEHMAEGGYSGDDV